MKKRRGVTKVCFCGKEYYVPLYRKDSAKFCSIFCQKKRRYERPSFQCKNCQRLFSASPSRKNKRIFCSIVCKASFESERVLDIKKKRRERIAKARLEGKIGKTGPAIRKFVLSEMEHKCQICGYREYLCCLDIHHVDSNPNNNNLENLAVLCCMCHRKVHRQILKL